MTMPWTGSSSCICTVPQPMGRRVENGVSYDPCGICGRPCPITKEQAEGRREQRKRNDAMITDRKGK